MKSRSIPFSDPMVRAILADRKTQTRRLAKPEDFGAATWSALPEDFGSTWTKFARPRHPRLGEAGDRLWISETWGLMRRNDPTEWFRGSIAGESMETALDFGWEVQLRSDWGPNQEGCFWRSPRYMPRWAARDLLLRITEVRVQRLQDISEADILAEGVDVPLAAKMTNTPWGHIPDLFTAWRFVWDSINGKRATWESNPWVWVISFEKKEP